ncbi:hypothetical protein [Butyricicoccus sp. OF10-2]|uniref:hypothetical protein n=1 Tax=Butyricicoccus sp. OF10-2 TaxID=2292298 RepID=UPI001FA9D844|nr:hypothetical protein [Butyricicoccus sp. OF10-2]
MKYTHKAPFDKGYNGMVSAVENPEMMGMEFGVVKMAAGDVMHFDYAQEVVYDLMSGSVTSSGTASLRPLPAVTCSTRVRSCCTFRRTPR